MSASAPVRLLITSALLALALVHATSVRAQAGPPDDRVLVLDWAPSTQARALELLLSGEAAAPSQEPADAPGATVRDVGVVRLLPATEQPRVLTDVKVLPNGTLLLTSRTGASVLLYAPASDTLQTLYKAPDASLSILESASAFSYAAQGQPTQLLLTDSYPSLGTVYEIASGLEPRRVTLYISGGRGFLVQGIVMPGGRLAFATNWPSAQTWGIDVIDLAEAPGSPESVRRFANRAHQGSPPDLTIMEELGELREIMALDAETLLVTTRFEVFTLKLDGTRGWRLDVGQHPEINGEFASARALPTGRVAIATYEPGRWTSPHTNHRVHWFAAPQPDTPPQRLASSEALERAPRRVEAASGTGGTGTLGFSAGLGALEPGGLDDLQVSEPLTVTPSPATAGATLTARLTLMNADARVIALKRLSVQALPGPCDAPTGATPALVAEARDVVIAPNTPYPFTGSTSATAPLTPGAWCAQVALEDPSGRVVELPSRAPFTIVADTTGPYQAPRQDLGLRLPGADMGGDADMGEPGGGGGEGCQCGQPPARTPAPWGWLWALGALIAWRGTGARWRGPARSPRRGPPCA